MADKNTRIKREQVEPLRSDDLDALNSPSVGQVPALGSGGQFEWTDILTGLFEIDINGDLMPITEVQSDNNFELDVNDDIEPKI
jgi:hypothetical protein